jgi:hypothetical protein
VSKSAKVVLGRGLINSQPQPDRCKLDKGKVFSREFVVAGDLIKEQFDQISGAVTDTG